MLMVLHAVVWAINFWILDFFLFQSRVVEGLAAPPREPAQNGGFCTTYVPKNVRKIFIVGDNFTPSRRLRGLAATEPEVHLLRCRAGT